MHQLAPASRAAAQLQESEDVGIGIPLMEDSWSPAGRRYNNDSIFDLCPQSVRELLNDTTRLYELDPKLDYLLPLPPPFKSWDTTNTFQLFGALLYPEGLGATGTGNRTLPEAPGMTWNDDSLAPFTWVFTYGGPCVYFEYVVDTPSRSVVPASKDCDAPYSHLSFTAEAAQRGDYSIYVSRAMLFSLQSQVNQSAATSQPEGFHCEVELSSSDATAASSASTTEIPPVVNTAAAPVGLPRAAIAGITASSIVIVVFIIFAVVLLQRTHKRCLTRRGKPTPYREFATAPTVTSREAKAQTTTTSQPAAREDESAFRDFFAAMRQAGITPASLLEHHRGPRSDSIANDRLPEYAAPNRTIP